MKVRRLYELMNDYSTSLNDEILFYDGDDNELEIADIDGDDGEVVVIFEQKFRGERMKITREKLLKCGFKIETILELGNKVGLVLYLKQGKDRFLHRLRWHGLEEPETLLIDCCYTRGWETVDEEDFLTNTNGLSSSAVEHYKEILEKIKEVEK